MEKGHFTRSILDSVIEMLPIQNAAERNASNVANVIRRSLDDLIEAVTYQNAVETSTAEPFSAEANHNIRSILDDIIETVPIQSAVEKYAADPANRQFSYLLREMKFSADSIRFGIDSWLEEMKQLKLKNLELNVKVVVLMSHHIYHISVIGNSFSLNRKQLLIWIKCWTKKNIFWNDCMTNIELPKINTREM